MRMIGTISSAVGFIFLGVWMIVDKSYPQLGDAMFKLWPLIIVILGLEVLAGISKKSLDAPKPRFNGLVIFVILVFLFVNGCRNVFDFNMPFHTKLSLNKLFTNGIMIDTGNYREIKAEKTLDASADSLTFRSDAAIVDIYKAKGNNMEIKAKVYVDKDSDMRSYDIKAQRNGTGYTVDINEGEVRKVAVDLYVPEDVKLTLNTDSAKIVSHDKLAKASYNIESDSGTLELKGGKTADVNLGSGIMTIEDVSDVKIDSDSGTINLSGDVPYVRTRLSSGMFKLDTDSTKNVDVELDSGTITINTQEKNLDVDAMLDSGTCSVNGEKRVNSGVKKTIGDGGNKIKVDLGSGILKISSRE